MDYSPSLAPIMMGQQFAWSQSQSVYLKLGREKLGGEGQVDGISGGGGTKIIAPKAVDVTVTEATVMNVPLDECVRNGAVRFDD